MNEASNRVPVYMIVVIVRISTPSYAPVAQLDRVPGFEPGGREFESLRARQLPLRPAVTSSGLNRKSA